MGCAFRCVPFLFNFTINNKKTMNKIIERLWANFKADTPKIAKRVRNIAAGISGCALAVMTALLAAQSQIPDWFNAIYPYLIGIPAAIAFISQFSSKKDE